MGKTLVLAEKPSVGRELARVLGCRQNGNGCIIGDRYIVTWTLGHLVTLADPEHYGNQFKTWSLETLPMLPPKMELVVMKETGKQFNTVRTLLKDPNVSELVIATDAGREGELVARWILEKAGFRKPIKRLWISSQTDKAIKEGFSKLKDARFYDNLYYSAKCRAEADWLVGLNVTRALTCRFNAQLSAGRVQTPTLALLVEREKEIKQFKPVDYWTIRAKLGAFSVTWRDVKGQTRLFSEEAAQKILQKVQNAQFTAQQVKKEIKFEAPPLLYDLTELQRDANKRFGFSAKKTLSVMQTLYEVHKVLTYPRTDSRYLSADIVPTLQERIKAISTGPYAETARELVRARKQMKSSFINDGKVSDHHAIIPTEQAVFLGNLNSDERMIFDLVAKRFLAAFCGEHSYEQLTVLFDANGEKFGAKGRAVREKGWKAVYSGSLLDDESGDDEGEQMLPPIKQNDKFRATDIRKVNGKTTPPARYTEATLLSAMEHPGKFISDAKMREIMESTSGLGTPATRAEIIERLLSAFYVERRGNSLFPTSKGIQLINLVPTDLQQPELTAKWEAQLSAISKGAANSNEFIKNIRTYAADLVKKVVASDAKYTHDNMSRERCPNCDKYLLEVAGKKGKMLVCQDRECGYRKSLSFLSNVQCPECRKKMEIFGDGEKRVLHCKCGYREKYDVFQKRMEEKKQVMSKREVSAYLEKQQAEQGGMTAMELAFKALQDKKNAK